MNEFCENGHYDCQFLGQFYSIKKPAPKISNDISKKLVDKIKEKQNEVNWEKKWEEKKLKRKREQENYSKQIPVGDGILNLEAVDICNN